ncbi:hypothetical protein [Zoogloea sp.]|uniref:hypothetical protein n=1 Tax=Zoogloea sp. TaxID=49181 RepID=UPI0026124365|nr:hypothetical protein [Zoogloea sp.]MDD3355055.1 hypothetical protein [Zoogloea sp.]
MPLSIVTTLATLSTENRGLLPLIAPFHGIVNLDVLQGMAEQADLEALSRALQEAGLAEPRAWHCLGLHPELRPHLRSSLPAEVLQRADAAWIASMLGYASFLARQQDPDPEAAASLAHQDQDNLLALLDVLADGDEPDQAMELGTLLFGLLQPSADEDTLARLETTCERGLNRFKAGWSAPRFAAQADAAEHLLASGHLEEAFALARSLYQRARWSGPAAYPEAGLDGARAAGLLARVLEGGDDTGAAIALLSEALGTLADQEECSELQIELLRDYGRLLLQQGEGAAALDSLTAALKLSCQLERPADRTACLHLIGLAEDAEGHGEAAEKAWREALDISAAEDNPLFLAELHQQIGHLCTRTPSRIAEATEHHWAAAQLCAQANAPVSEGHARTHLASALLKQGLLQEALDEIQRAIRCKADAGDTAVPWTSWGVLADIQRARNEEKKAHEAREKAVETYLAHRRTGAENTNLDGRLAHLVLEGLEEDAAGELDESLAELAGKSGFPARLRPFMTVLRAIVAGNRDPKLADHPGLDYSASVEIHLLLNRLTSS